MVPYRMSAVIVGVLFTSATVAALLTGLFLGFTLEARDYLAGVVANDARVTVAVLFELILAVSVLGIGFFRGNLGCFLLPAYRRRTALVTRVVLPGWDHDLACWLLIIWYAWNWREPAARVEDKLDVSERVERSLSKA